VAYLGRTPYLPEADSIEIKRTDGSVAHLRSFKRFPEMADGFSYMHAPGFALFDKDAALSAGYSLSVAENTKQRVWRPRVRAEWERLRCERAASLLAGEAQ
jgi:hypothetical protein